MDTLKILQKPTLRPRTRAGYLHRSGEKKRPQNGLGDANRTNRQASTIGQCRLYWFETNLQVEKKTRIGKWYFVYFKKY
jgi:hypothetical protein